ncbi:UPF0425 pyridoxal phosphate-dependent protein [Frankliniella fusca]|uniref:UPF0425 pyridoxal phosphate-dependent protein n=1 Tax=Frankliniella fusca TaxID=407009 RepID=A0AAE1LSY5_9NEOP|nr:UPF0425 pyridoxal phosphate-dependent protein [Frankliniella fusca]
MYRLILVSLGPSSSTDVVQFDLATRAAVSLGSAVVKFGVTVLLSTQARLQKNLTDFVVIYSGMDSTTNVWLCGCFLEKPVKFTCSDAPLSYKHKTGGDLFWMRRTTSRPVEMCVVLGTGVTKFEARQKANNYLQRLGRIHGSDETPEVLEFACTEQTEFSQ